MLEGEASEGDPLDGGRYGALKLDQMFEPDSFDYGIAKVRARGWIKVKCVLRLVEEPLAGGIQFFEDVLHKSILRMHRFGPIVLPPALIGEIALCILSGDLEVHITPEIL